MTILISPIAPDLARRPAGPATLGALLAAIRRLFARRKARARRMAAMRRLAEAEDGLLRDIGVRRADLLAWLREETGGEGRE